jgi:hypothetical protein
MRQRRGAQHGSTSGQAGGGERSVARCRADNRQQAQLGLRAVEQPT